MGVPFFLNFMSITQIAYDIVEDIMVHGDQMRDTLQKLQEAVHMTKVLHVILLSFISLL